jgi:hypothetical protein
MIDTPSSDCNTDIESNYINASYIDVKKVSKKLKNFLEINIFVLTNNYLLGSFRRRLQIIHCCPSSAEKHC